MKRLLLTLGLLAATMVPSAAFAQECSSAAFKIADIQGVYAAPNIRMTVYPCGGVALATGREGTLYWAGTYYARTRLVDGTILIGYTPRPNFYPLIYNGIEFRSLALTPDVPGVMRVWSVTGDNNWFDEYLDKTSDEPVIP